VTIDAFSPATSTRCQGSGNVTYTTTATNSTGITYSLDAASTAGGNTINTATGEVTYAAGWSGTTTITASAAGCNGPATTDHVVTVNPLPLTSVSGATSVCDSTIETYSTTNNIGNTYSWVVTRGTILSGQGTNSITVRWDWDTSLPVGTPSATGAVQVTEEVTSTGCAVTNPSYNVTVYRTPQTGPTYHIQNSY